MCNPMQRNMEEELRVGCAKVDITPQKPMELAGFAHRSGHFQAVRHPLHLRTIWMEQGNGHGKIIRSILISADLLFWGNALANQMKEKISKQWEVDQDAILLHATHNHSGPQTSDEFCSSLGTPDEEYLMYLEEQLEFSVAMARENLEPVTLSRHTGQCHIGINRRKIVNGKAEMAPNPSGSVDPELSLLRFDDAEGQIKALVVHYACHPTTSGENVVTSEYCGVAMDMIEERLHFAPASIAVFLQGFCANVRPKLLKDHEFYRGGLEEVEDLATKLADEAVALLKRKVEPVKQARLSIKRQSLPLNLQEMPTIDYLQELVEAQDADPPEASIADEKMVSDPKLKSLEADDRTLREWAQFLLSRPDRLHKVPSLDMTLLELADDCKLLTMNAEMSVEYGIMIKSAYPGQILPVSCTNGIIGYVSTDSQLLEGGYEALDFIYYFGLPAPYATGTEEAIRKQIDNLLSS